MSNLQEILNTPVDLDVDGFKVPVKKASMADFLDLQKYLKDLEDKKDNSASVKSLIYAIFLCMRKADKAVTLEMVEQNLPVSMFSKVGEIMKTLGFPTPPAEKRPEVKVETKTGAK